MKAHQTSETTNKTNPVCGHKLNATKGEWRGVCVHRGATRGYRCSLSPSLLIYTGGLGSGRRGASSEHGQRRGVAQTSAAGRR